MAGADQPERDAVTHAIAVLTTSLERPERDAVLYAIAVLSGRAEGLEDQAAHASDGGDRQRMRASQLDSVIQWLAMSIGGVDL